jgi:hypothetical protein
MFVPENFGASGVGLNNMIQGIAPSMSMYQQAMLETN